MSPKKAAKTAPRHTSTWGSGFLTAEEKAVMTETLNERRRARSGKVDGESDVLARIAEMPRSDRVIAERIHAIVKATAPNLTAKTWYGMPADVKDGKVICFFQSEQSSSRGTQPSVSSKTRTSTTATFGPPRLP